MARRRITGGEQNLNREQSSTPALQDEADILEEVGAQPESEDDSELVATKEKILEVGAVDADSVRENRRVESIVGKKRAGVANVSFNTGEVISTYDAILKCWPPNTIDISVRRLTGTAVQRMISSRPRSGAELYEALLAFHGSHEEADYEVKFLDIAGKQWRGKGRIVMPDTRSSPQQGQQPMNPYPPGYPPPGYPHPYAGGQTSPGYPPGYPLAAASASAPQQSQQLPPQPPVVVHAPPAPDMGSAITSMGQLFEIFQKMQQQAAPPPVAAYVPPPPPQPQPYLPPPPPPGADLNASMAWMVQAFDIFRSMQPPQVPPMQPPPASTPAQVTPPPAPNPMMGMVPPAPPSPGMIWVPGIGYMSIEHLMQAQAMAMGLGEAPRGPTPGYRRGPYQAGPGGPRDFGERPRDERPRGPYDERPPQYQPPPPPPRERSAAEQFRDALTVVRTAVDVARDFSSIAPQSGGVYEPPEPPAREEDDSPIRVIDTGKGKVVLDKNNGGFRGWETLYANLPDLLKWGGEQRELIQKAHTEQQQRQQQKPQLPPGYVEVGPGYQPPPGFVAVPVEPQYAPPPQQPLPPPPAHVPPPIQRTWEPPTFPEEENQ